jgi:hypothetical protein
MVSIVARVGNEHHPPSTAGGSSPSDDDHRRPLSHPDRTTGLFGPSRHLSRRAQLPALLARVRRTPLSAWEEEVPRPVGRAVTWGNVRLAGGSCHRVDRR